MSKTHSRFEAFIRYHTRHELIADERETSGKESPRRGTISRQPWSNSVAGALNPQVPDLTLCVAQRQERRHGTLDGGCQGLWEHWGCKSRRFANKSH